MGRNGFFARIHENAGNEALERTILINSYDCIISMSYACFVLTCVNLSFFRILHFPILQDPGETHSSSMAGLRGRTTTDGDLEKAMLSPRLATVQSAMEHALRSKDYDPALFKRVKNWYNELDRRTGLLKYCKSIRGQGWDGECLAVRFWRILGHFFYFAWNALHKDPSH